MFGFPCRCVERGCYSCGVSLDTHLETQAVIKKPETAHARLCRRAYVFAQIKACAHTTTHRKSAHPATRKHTQKQKQELRAISFIVDTRGMACEAGGSGRLCIPQDARDTRWQQV